MSVKKFRYALLALVVFMLVSLTFFTASLSASPLTMAQVYESKILTFDNEFAVNDMLRDIQYPGSWYPTYDLENGYMRMNLRETTKNNEDGFVVNVHDYLNDVEISDYNYLQFKIKRENCKNAKLTLQINTVVGSLSKEFYINPNFVEDGDSGNDGHWLIVTLDLSVGNTQDEAITVYDVDAGTTSSYTYARASGSTFGTTQNTTNSDNYNLRLNVARQVLPEKTVLIEYLGYFADKNEALTFDGNASVRINNAKEKIASGITVGYGDGASSEKACRIVKSLIHDNGGCGVEFTNTQYVAPATDTKGRLYFDAVFTSAGVSETVQNCSITIEKMPSEPVMVRFNNLDTIEKLVPGDVSLALTEGGYMKMEKLTPTKEDGFYFYLNTPGVVDSFNLQDYPYIKIKYKPMQISGTYQIYFTNPGEVDTDKKSFSFNTPSWDKNVWLSSIIDTSKVEDSMTLYNFETGDLTYVDRTNNTDVEYTGQSNSFRFTFGRKQNQEKICYIEYIAFFPSYEMALNYNENGEKFKADSLTKLYNNDFSIPYYDGITQNGAEEYVKNYAQSLFGDGVISVDTVSYVAPQDKTLGKIKFTLNVINDRVDISFSTKELECFIDSKTKSLTPVWKFNSKLAIDCLSPANESVLSLNEDGLMKISSSVENGGFTFDVPFSYGVNISNYNFVKLSYKALKDFDLSVTLKGTNEILRIDKLSLKGSEDYVDVILDLSSCKLYEKKQQSFEVNDFYAQGKLSSVLTSFKLEFSSINAIDLDYIAFANNLSQADDCSGDVYSGTAFENLNNFNFAVDYVNAKDLQGAIVTIGKKIESVLPADVSLYNLEIKSYKSATKLEQGSVTYSAVLRYGSDIASAFTTVKGELTVDSIPESLAKEIVFSEENDNFILETNVNSATANYDDDRLFAQTDYALTEDGFGVIVNSVNIDLDVYKYIKIRYNLIGMTATESGRSLLFFFTETGCSGELKSYMEFNLGDYNTAGQELFVIIDVDKLETTLYNAQTNSVVSHGKIVVTGDYSGVIKSLKFTFLRNVTTDRSILLDYVSFFSSEEEAIAYNGDTITDSVELLGSAFLESANSISGVSKLSAEIKISFDILSESLIVGTHNAGLYIKTDGNLLFKSDNYSLSTTNQNLFSYKWYKVEVIYDGSKVQISIDGKIVAEDNYAISLTSSVKYFVGGFSAGEDNFTGYIKNVRLANDSEILAEWTLENKSYNKFENGIDKDNYLTYVDYYGNLSHEFMGSDYLYTTEALTENPNTFELWVKPYKTQTDANPVLLSNEHVRIFLDQTGNINVKFGNTLLTTNGLNLYNGKWVHLAVVKDIDNSSVTLYYNGEVYQTWNAVSFEETDKDKTCFTFGAAVSSADGFIAGDSVVLYLDGTQTKNDILLENSSIKVLIDDSGAIQMLFDGCFGYFGKVTLNTKNISDSYSFVGKRCYVKIISDVTNQRVYLDVADSIEKIENHEVEDKGFAVQGTVYVDKRDGFVHTFEWVWHWGYLYSFDAREKDSSFVGEIGNVRIWSSTRTQTEIKENMFDFYSDVLIDATLLADWHFDYSHDLVYTDYSSNGAGAKIFAFSWFRTNMDPDDYVYAMAVFPDTQNNVLTDHYTNDTLVDWVIANKDEYNFVTSMHVGDITQNATDLEWEWVYESYSKLDGILPFTVSFGNHDYPALSGKGSGIREADKFNSLWDSDKYIEIYGEENIGFYKYGEMQNIYLLYSDGERDFIQFAIEYAPRDEVLEWVGIMADRYSDRDAILIVHSYLNIWSTMQGTRVGSQDAISADLAKDGSTTINEGLDIWEKVVKRHTNFVQVICGHQGAQGDGFHYTVLKNEAGQDVVISLIDTSGEGGFPSSYGIMGIIEYNSDTSSAMYMYSPLKNAYYRTDAYYNYSTHTVNG